MVPDLPDETYRDCDVDVVYSEFNRLLTGIGSVHSHWQGPTETALYVYGLYRSRDAHRVAAVPRLLSTVRTRQHRPDRACL